MKDSPGVSEKVKNELLEIVRKQGLVSPRLRMASAEMLWVFNLNPTDIAKLASIARNSRETTGLRARVFHTIEIKSPAPYTHSLYREITGENIEDIYTSRPLPPLPVARSTGGQPRTLYLARAMGYSGVPGTAYTIGRDHELEEARRRRSDAQKIEHFKEDLLRVRGNTSSCQPSHFL